MASSSGGFMEFRCDFAGDRNASRLCLNGGVCGDLILVGNTSIEVCFCPPDVIHDFTLGHFRNCGMSASALPAMFGVVSCISLISWMISIPAFFAVRAKARTIMGLFVVETFLNWLVFLCVWVEQGMYASGVFFFAMLILVINRGAAETTLVLSLPIFSMFHKSMARLKMTLIVIECTSAVSILTLMALLMVWAKDEDTNRYNSALVILQLILSLTICCLVGAAGISSIRLYSSIRSNLGEYIKDSKMAEFVGRLKEMIRSNSLGAIFSLLLFGFPILSLVLKSFPGQYVMFFVYHAAIPVFVSLGAINFKADQAAAGTASINSKLGNPNSKDHNSKDSKEFNDTKGPNLKLESSGVITRKSKDIPNNLGSGIINTRILKDNLGN